MLNFRLRSQRSIKLLWLSSLSLFLQLILICYILLKSQVIEQLMTNISDSMWSAPLASARHCANRIQTALARQRSASTSSSDAGRSESNQRALPFTKKSLTDTTTTSSGNSCWMNISLADVPSGQFLG